MMPLSVGLRSCFSSTRKPRSSGRPASTSVANWRVKVVRTLDFTSPLKPGNLDVDVDPPPFLPLPAALAPALAAFLSGLLLGLVHLDDLGREQAHLLDAPDGFVLAGDFEGALGLLALGIHGHVTEFRHNGSFGCSGVFHDFFDGGIAVEDAAQAVLAQGDHAQLDGLLAQHHRRRALVDQVADRRR